MLDTLVFPLLQIHFFWEFKSQIQGVCRLHQLFMPLAKTKTVWQYLLQVTSLNSNSFQDVAGAASQRLLSYKYALTNYMLLFRGILTVFYVWHTRYEGNRNMNNMVEEQPEYPETDSPVKNVFLLPIFNRALPINWTIPYPIISEIHVSTQYSIEKYFVLLSQINSGVAAWSSILGSVWSHRASTTSHFKTLAYLQVRAREGSLVSS